jgi:hypothetical protein
MTTTEVISPDLKTVLRRLKLSRMLDSRTAIQHGGAAAKHSLHSGI